MQKFISVGQREADGDGDGVDRGIDAAVRRDSIVAESDDVGLARAFG